MRLFPLMALCLQVKLEVSFIDLTQMRLPILSQNPDHLLSPLLLQLLLVSFFPFSPSSHRLSPACFFPAQMPTFLFLSSSSHHTLVLLEEMPSVQHSSLQTPSSTLSR